MAARVMALWQLMSQVLPVDEWIRAKVNKLLDNCDVLALVAYPLWKPKLVPLSSANSPWALGMLPHLPLSPIWEQEAIAVQQGKTSSAKSRSVKELWPNATPIKQYSTVLSSNQSMPVANESGASTQPWRTPASILNHEL